ncbi:MAG: hypothetical protein KatS3mg092_0444 [Patescibacteria group bacterium]|nr:MAG: hypothetical protein KatS3mg092_0444 [Patescibacteria group bacterium]
MKYVIITFVYLFLFLSKYNNPINAKTLTSQQIITKKNSFLTASINPNFIVNNRFNYEKIFDYEFIQSIKKSKEKTKNSSIIGIFSYSMMSIIYIMIFYFAIGMGSDFSLLLMIFSFMTGGFIGSWLNAYEFAFIICVILSLIFVGEPKKDL